MVKRGPGSGQERSAYAAVRLYSPGFSRLRDTLPLYLVFAVTGIGVAFPGAVLPVLLTRWHFGDEQGGSLFLMAWIGSSVGALLVAGSLRRALGFGSLAVALSSFGLTLCSRRLAAPIMLLYGLGLGAVMTSVSLMRQQQSLDSGRELVRLNLLWAVGACACPALTIHTLITGDLRPILLGLTLVFALLAGWCASQQLCQRTRPSAGQPVPQDHQHQLPQPVPPSSVFRDGLSVFRTVPFGLIVLVMFITGVEASGGAWLATYAKRGGDPLAQIVAAPTCLWAGLLLSRLFWSFFASASKSNRIVRASLLLMGLASGLLLTSRHGWPLLLAAGALGFGIGPTYPLLLALALRRYRGGSIFFLAGVGSACLPWLTGMVSTRTGSLHAGFIVPAAATLVMIALSLTLPLTQWSHATVAELQP
jgi:FHS family glucose/mannose:H+ symporter-like MFS transporter